MAHLMSFFRPFLKGDLWGRLRPRGLRRAGARGRQSSLVFFCISYASAPSGRLGPRVSDENILDIAGVLRHVPGPAPKAAVFVDRPRPFIKKSAFGPVLIAVPALGFQHEYVPGLEPDEEVGPILAHHAAMDIEHLEAEMIVLHPGIDQGVVVQLEGFGCLPSVLS